MCGYSKIGKIGSKRKLSRTVFQGKAEHLLTDAGIAGQGVGVCLDSEVGWTLVVDPQHSTPLPKVSTVFLILSTALRKAIEPCKSQDREQCLCTPVPDPWSR